MKNSLNTNVKLSWLSEDNWKNLIEAGYLPVLAINYPNRFKNTAIHFPELAPNLESLRTSKPEFNYLKGLYQNVNRRHLFRIFDVLTHLACADGIVVLTEKEDDPYRKILGKFLAEGLENGASEYEWDRGNSENLADI